VNEGTAAIVYSEMKGTVDKIRKVKRARCQCKFDFRLKLFESVPIDILFLEECTHVQCPVHNMRGSG
jgi:hypothetical protein